MTADEQLPPAIRNAMIDAMGRNANADQNRDMPGDDQARVQAWVDKDMYRRLRLLAVDRETSVAEVVRQLLDDALRRLDEGDGST